MSANRTVKTTRTASELLFSLNGTARIPIYETTVMYCPDTDGNLVKWKVPRTTGLECASGGGLILPEKETALAASSKPPSLLALLMFLLMLVGGFAVV